jgi:hypothetical protein
LPEPASEALSPDHPLAKEWIALGHERAAYEARLEKERADRMALQTRLAESEQWVQVHRAQLTEKEEMLKAHLAEYHRLVDIERFMQAEIERRTESERQLEQTLLAEIRRLAAHERELYFATFQMGERDKAQLAEIRRLMEREQEEIQRRLVLEQTLVADIQRRAATEQALRMELDAMRRSPSGRLARMLTAGGRILVPAGSRRRRVLQLGWRGLATWRRAGIRTLCRRVVHKIGQRFARAA